MSIADDEETRRERAERLRREIARLRSGERKKASPRSPREFTDERAREERVQKPGRSRDQVRERDTADDA